jgi:hypothetical protein
MSGISWAVRLCAVTAVSVVSVSAEAALSCPFADGNGTVAGACITEQGTWRTSLQARDWAGNGVGVDAYYDSFLNLTWLADANWAQTSDHDSDGLMTFGDAKAWADGLTLFGGSDWRLPTVTPVNDATHFNTTFSNNGSTDWGYARTGVGGGWGRHSEMGYMFYVHLGNKGFATPNDAEPGSQVMQSGWGPTNTGPFANLQPAPYWTDRAFDSSFAWSFGFGDGFQNHGSPQSAGRRAWAVHPGDLLIPVPAALPLFVSAVAVVLARARRR